MQSDAQDDVKTAARDVLIAVAQRNGTITYRELVNYIRARIPNCDLEHRDPRLNRMLGEISTHEDAAGRGMLTAVVVREDDGQPGRGFFKLAGRRGHDISDRDHFLTEELKKIYAAWS